MCPLHNYGADRLIDDAKTWTAQGLKTHAPSSFVQKNRNYSGIQNPAVGTRRATDAESGSPLCPYNGVTGKQGDS